MKMLVLGDLHCKPWILDAFCQDAEQYDKIIFLGDACDNFGCTQSDNFSTLIAIADYKEKLGDKFVWLLGNHDWGYYDNSVKMSGHIEHDSVLIHDFLKQRKDSWDIVYKGGGYLFSHAGVTNEFIKHPVWRSGMGVAKMINRLKAHPGWSNPLNNVGLSCGGYSLVPSPLWMRPEDLARRDLQLLAMRGCKQVVGHTPVHDIQFHQGMLCIDTFSQYRDGTPYGDQTALLIDGEKLYIIKTDGTIEREITKEEQEWGKQ